MHARWEKSGNHYVVKALVCIPTSFLCEAVDLLLLSTSSQVESLHCNIVGNFSSYKREIMSGPLLYVYTQYLVLG